MGLEGDFDFRYGVRLVKLKKRIHKNFTGTEMKKYIYSSVLKGTLNRTSSSSSSRRSSSRNKKFYPYSNTNKTTFLPFYFLFVLSIFSFPTFTVSASVGPLATITV